MVAQNAVVWTGTDLHVATRALDEPRGRDVLVRLEAIGLCSSDFHIWRGRKAGAPGILGHEGAGVVAAVGDEAARRWTPGDFVIVNPLLSCGRCASCANGLEHICPDREIVGYNGRGLIATAQILDERSLVAPPPGLPRRHACLVEPMACVVHAQRRVGGPPEENVLILGGGPMGVMHAAYARRRGVDRIWLCDREARKLDLARSKGVPADEWILLHDLAPAVDALTDGQGAETTIIANSMRDGHEPAFELTRSGGRVLAFASILDRPGPIALPAGAVDSDGVHRREETVEVLTHRGPVTIVGCIGFDAQSFREAADVLAEIDGDQFISAVRRLDDVPALASDEWTNHLKIVIYPAL